MNYRKHLSVPSSNRVVASVVGHPELSRLIELPRDAPREWLAYAYLLSIGVDADAHELDYLDVPARWSYDDWDPRYGLTRVDAPVTQERMRLPGVPGELRLTQMGEVKPTVGDQQVAVFPADETTPAQPPSTRWQVSPPPFRPDAINHELARRYGVVLPKFDASALADDRDGYRRVPLIDSLLAGLAPIRRIALRAHLDQVGLRDETRRADDSHLEQAAEPLLRLLDGISPEGVGQDAETGWLPHGFRDELASALSWDEGKTADVTPGDVLVGVARGARLIRRLRGRVVITSAARKLISDPAREIVQVLSNVLSDSGRGYYSTDFSCRASTAAALLAVADGSALELDDLAGIAELAASARRRRGEEYDGDYGYGSYGDGARADSTPHAVESVVECLRALSAPGAFGEISAAMRAVARQMLL